MRLDEKLINYEFLRSKALTSHKKRDILTDCEDKLIKYETTKQTDLIGGTVIITYCFRFVNIKSHKKQERREKSEEA